MPEKQRARVPRRNATEAERCLWRHLRDRQLRGHKFRRQHPIGPYVVDFVCMEKSLVIELDGGHHANRAAEDDVRSRKLEAFGFHVLRFWNHEALSDTEGVLRKILESLGSEPS